ncbi:TetR/AcrR family transcriptional regulator [Nocardioides sp. GY 10127]|uniref:TetR/AcrR family transcriptional regulator n=1 Tax=Nocardioides sp. GY 10127 TaxID=2569762 RepID=UPI0010A93E36|nr:TetR/AcrR family transcriptional regulator [Nocardioides sp. GY 10127]TIC79332.1 TetR/AcrR family transcriptional regulator [Nocardioides sp. GY 10127]
MTGRRQYAKGAAKREEILQVALEVVGRAGPSGATVREIAAAADISPTGLMHHFGSKDELFAAVLAARDADSTRFMPAAGPALDRLTDGLTALVRHNADVAGLVELYVQVLAEAMGVDHAAHAYAAERYVRVRAAMSGALAAAVAEGDLRADLDPDVAGALLVATMDGLQNMWLYDRSLDMAAHLESLLLSWRAPVGADVASAGVDT